MHLQLRCEVCGRKVFGKPFRVNIEGAKLTVCNDCSKHGKIVWEEELKPKTGKPKAKAQLPLKIPSRRTPEAPSGTTLELVEDFDLRIRQAREKLGFSHEELGKKINEKLSLLRKIEMKKMRPDNVLATKLEHTLKIELIVPAQEEKALAHQPTMAKPVNQVLTLGDIIQENEKDKKAKEDPTERKQS